MKFGYKSKRFFDAFAFFWVILAIVIMVIPGCGGGGGDAPVQTPSNTANTAPVANVGADQTVETSATVNLNAVGCTDADGDLLTYAWSLPIKPAGSTTSIANSTSVQTSFIPDVDGTYTVQLIVNDGTVNSTAATMVVTATTANIAPIADAGVDQAVYTGTSVDLDSSGSSDANGDSLTYAWSLPIMPGGSFTSIANDTSAQASFVPDVDGTYTVQLIVNDGTVDSPADTMVITATTANIAPIADAGADQAKHTGVSVSLDGSGSSDANGDSLTYAWSITNKPAGSIASVADATSANASFIPDVDGTYTLQLVVNDGTVNSPADTVVVTATTDTAGTVTVAGQVWMDRNLGASRVAISPTDSAAYGDLYQWGRGADGHQISASLLTPTTSSTDVPGHGNFITTNNAPYNWRIPPNYTLWQGVAGINNPCPAGFRLPTSSEWGTAFATLAINDSASAFASPLKLVVAGLRNFDDGTYEWADTIGIYWTSDHVVIDDATCRAIESADEYPCSANRAFGLSVRCLQD